MGWRDFQTSTPIEKIENIDNMKTEAHLFDKLDKFYKDGKVKPEAVYCLWLKQDVPPDECHKPFGCFYRKEDDTPVECIHLKAFIRQRNRELELNG